MKYFVSLTRATKGKVKSSFVGPKGVRHARNVVVLCLFRPWSCTTKSAQVLVSWLTPLGEGVESFAGWPQEIFVVFA